MPLLSRKRVIALKLEANYGTLPTIAAADCVLVRDLNIQPANTTMVSRDLIRPFLGASEQLPANTQVVVTFSVELAGSGTAGTVPRYDAALQACGMSSTVVASPASVTYAPISNIPSSISITYSIGRDTGSPDSVLHTVTGCRGSFVLNATVGEIPTLDFTFTGIFNGPTDANALVPTYGAQASPLIFKLGNTSAMQLHSFAGCFSSVTFDLGNTLVYRELVGCLKQVLITDRNATGTVVLEAPTMAQKNYFTNIDTGTTGNLTFLHGTTAGNIIEFTAPRTSLTSVAYEDQDSVHMLNAGYTAVAQSAAVPEVSLKYT
jgi:hypothetical protein